MTENYIEPNDVYEATEEETLQIMWELYNEFVENFYNELFPENIYVECKVVS